MHASWRDRASGCRHTEEEKLLVNPDLDFIAKRAADLKDFWDKEFKRA